MFSNKRPNGELYNEDLFDVSLGQFPFYFDRTLLYSQFINFDNDISMELHAFHYPDGAFK